MKNGLSMTARFFFWSEYKDSNLGPPGPKPGALPGCATLRKMKLYSKHHTRHAFCCAAT